MNHPKFISIVGQTATGKTAKAFALAKLWYQKYHQEVVVISADSKQVFTELTILSGADVPKDFKKKSNENIPYSFFINPDLPISLHGTNNLNGNQEWSVGHFHNLVKKLIENYPKSLFIVVGGTGLYHQQIYHPAETLHVKPNQELREALANNTLAELQVILENRNPEKLANMNNSDRNNPRRLVRAIETIAAEIEPSHYPQIEPLLQIGLTTTNIEEKIRQRVLKRLEQGVIEEVKNFETKYQEPNLQAKATLGYQEILKFINQEINDKQLIEHWTLSETQYAKRQTTWWKKRENIQWSEANKLELAEVISKL
ncbi:MAG: tRNA (adenosine(37)-N6)-dimethylallyltransferase [Patescibacteria group bacterium]